MREIKFRIWDKKQLRMLNLDLISFAKKQVTVYTGTVWKDYNYSKRGDVYIMQFTGLKDKTGKEIYEGDIYKYENEIDKLSSIDELYFNELLEYRMHDGEVIGNIYENPELLEVRDAREN